MLKYHGKEWAFGGEIVTPATTDRDIKTMFHDTEPNLQGLGIACRSEIIHAAHVSSRYMFATRFIITNDTFNIRPDLRLDGSSEC
jgi:hypothetical protein